jgi:hypothetical protein
MLPYRAMRLRASADGSALFETLAALAVAIAVAAVLTWPLVAGIDRASRLDNGDALWGMWAISWVARTLVVDPADVFNANVFHPHRGVLAVSEHFLLEGALAIPVYWATGNPILAYNVIILLALGLTAVAAYFLARRLSGSRVAAAAGAIAFAFSPYMMARLANIHLMMAWGFPLGLLTLHRFVERRTAGRAATLGLVIFLQGLATGYYGVFVGVVVGFGALFYAISRDLWRERRYWIGLAGAAGLSVVLMLPIMVLFIQQQRELGLQRTLEHAAHYSADWRAYLASPARAHAWMTRLLGRWNEVLFPGFLTIGLAVVGGRALYRGSQAKAWQHTDDHDVHGAAGLQAGRETLLFYSLLAGLAFWASFGPRAGLYAALYKVIPLLSFLRAPARFGVLVVLALSMLAACGVAWLLASPSRARRIAGRATCAALIVELAAIPLFLPRAEPTPSPYRLLASLPRGAVLCLPFFTAAAGYHRHTLYMFYSVYHWQPMINGYSDYFPADFRRNADRLAGFPSTESFDILRQKRVRYVVVHTNLYNASGRRRLREGLVRYREYLRPLITDGDVWLYEIVAFPST